MIVVRFGRHDAFYLWQAFTAAAAGRPPSLAATVIAPQSCCVAAMSAQCGSIPAVSKQHLRKSIPRSYRA